MIYVSMYCLWRTLLVCVLWTTLFAIVLLHIYQLIYWTRCDEIDSYSTRINLFIGLEGERRNIVSYKLQDQKGTWEALLLLRAFPLVNVILLQMLLKLLFYLLRKMVMHSRADCSNFTRT